MFHFSGRLGRTVILPHRIAGDGRLNHLSTLLLYPIHQEWLDLWLVRPHEHASVVPIVEALRNTDCISDGMCCTTSEREEAEENGRFCFHFSRGSKVWIIII